jgi:hypothetical protein
VRLGQTALRNFTEFKYLGIILTENLLGGSMRNIPSEDATQRLILLKALRANLRVPTQVIYWCFKKALSSLLYNAAEYASLGCLTAI